VFYEAQHSEGYEGAQAARSRNRSIRTMPIRQGLMEVFFPFKKKTRKARRHDVVGSENNILSSQGKCS
jgi:hypothetical protein